MFNKKETVKRLLSIAGISVDGNNAWDIKVNDETFYGRVLAGGSLALGETYMDKLWDCDRPDEFFYRVLKADLEKEIKKNLSLILPAVFNKIINKQSSSKAFINAQKHYDIGNDLFSRMLDKNMLYTCAYWKNAATLDEAQLNKMDLICKKLHLQPGMSLLDIGCGWGGFAKFAAQNYGVNVTGITVAKEQVHLAEEVCKGLPVTIKLMDYRDMNEPFDHIVSLGMFEHVGHKNYRTYMQVAERCLKPEGLFLLHTIGNGLTKISPDPWIAKYIFPNYLIPSAGLISKAFEEFFILEDWQNFGTYYDTTLMAWYKNFINSYEEIKDKYDERFYRMWTYYLTICAASFRANKNFLWQIVLAKNDKKGFYEAVR